MKSAWKKLLLVAVLAGLVVAIWRMQPPRPRTGADFLPADTPACLIVADMPGMRQHWAASTGGSTNHFTSEGRAFGTVWDEVPRWFKELGPLVAQGVDRFGDGEVFVALTGLQTTPTIAPQLAVGIQLGARRGTVAPWREEFRTLMRREFPKTSSEKQRLRGMDYEQWCPHPGLEFCVTELEGYLLLTLGSAPMMDVIERIAEPSRNTLAGCAEFHQMCRRLPPQRDVMLAVQAGPFAAKMDPLLRWLPQLQILGEPFAGARFLGWAQIFGTNDVRDAMVVARAPATGQPPEAVPVAVLGRLPASCTLAMVARAEPREVYRQLTRAMTELGQRDWVKSVALMEVGWSAAGVDFSKDMLGSLGNPCALAWDRPDGVKSTQWVFGAPLRDPASFVNATERLAAIPQAAPLRWRMADGWLWMSSSTEALDRVCHSMAGTAPSLGNDPQWARRLEELPRSGWMWAYADPTRLPDKGAGGPSRKMPLMACLSSFGDSGTATVSSASGMLPALWQLVEQLADRPSPARPRSK